MLGQKAVEEAIQGPENRSLAVWYKSIDPTKEQATNPKLEMHFNLWDCRNGAEKPGETFLDIGLKLWSCDDVEEIYIFLPFKIAKTDISDIGDKLNNEPIAVGIFNEPLEVSDNKTRG